MASISTMYSLTIYPNASASHAMGIAIDFLNETKGFKDELLKVLSYGLKWFKAFHGGYLSMPASRTLASLENAKNLIGVRDFFKHAKNFVEYVFRWINGSALTTEELEKNVSFPTEMFFETVEMVNPAKDVLTFAKDHQLVTFDTMAQVALETLGSAALILGFGRSAKFAVAEIEKANSEILNPRNLMEQKLTWQATAVKNWLDLAKCVSYIALGILLASHLIATAVGATTIAVVVMQRGLVPLGLATSALIFGLASHFHEKLSVLSDQKVGLEV